MEIISTLLLCVLLMLFSSTISAQSAALLVGRWVPETILDIVQVRNTTNGTLLLLNLMPTATNNWTDGVVTYFENGTISTSIWTTFTPHRTIVNIGTAIGSFQGREPFLELLWSGITLDVGVAVPSAFDHTPWHKYGTDVLCRTNLEPFFNSFHDTARQAATLEVPRRYSEDEKNEQVVKNDGKILRNDEKATSPVKKTYNVSKVHVIFTQHFDLGYTDFAWCVVSHYFWYIFPGTALTATQSPSYIYTTHSWLLYFFFNCEELLPFVKPPPGIGFACPTPAVKTLVEGAIVAGQMVWHRFPFDGFNEMLGQTLFDLSFSFGDWLSEKFQSQVPPGRGQLFSMQQVDVPGLYRVQVPLLQKNGVRAVYVGQNYDPYWCGAIADIPTLFQWQGFDPTADPLLVFTHKFGYGGLGIRDAVIDEVTGTALLVQCTLENHPPYTPQDIEMYLDRIANEFPSAPRSSIIPSTFDAFALDVMSAGFPRSDLPTVHADIGDSWVRAVGGDPVKVSSFMEQRRQIEECVAAGKCSSLDADTRRAALFTITGCEHNWGLPWQASDYETTVLSYQEKRDMVTAGQLSKEKKKRSIPHNEYVSPTGGLPLQCSFEGQDYQLSISYNESTGALNGVSFTLNNRTVEFADADHNLLRVLFAVHETLGPLPTQQNNGWGDIDPSLPATFRYPKLISFQRVGQSCTFQVDSQINQSYFDNNTKTFAVPTDGGYTSVIMMLQTTFSFTPISSSAVQLNASLQIKGVERSDTSGLFYSWNRDFSYGSSLSVQFLPRLPYSTSLPSISLTSLGANYSPFDFHRYGTCQYHLVDLVYFFNISEGNASVSVQTLHTPLLLFGVSNATFVSTVGENGRCRPEVKEGAWFNIWNQWNANWVVGFPFDSSCVDDMCTFEYRVRFENIFD